MKLPSRTSVAALAVVGVTAAPLAHAVPTLVQYDPTGAGAYSITGVQEFDWQSSSSTVIEDTIVGFTEADAAGDLAGVTTLGGFFAAAQTGDTVTFNLHAQTRLDDMVGSTPSPVPGLDTDGSANGDNGFEITALLSATETAVVTSSPNSIPGLPLTIFFTSISGTWEMYHDDTPDSNNVTGVGFDDAPIQIMNGTISGTSGTFTTTAPGVGNGSAFLDFVVSSYDSMYIEADPLAGAPLLGATFDGTLDLDFGIASPINVGATTGTSGYTVLADDLILSSDGKSQFSVPEPTTLLLLGGGLVGVAGFSRRKVKSSARG